MVTYSRKAIEALYNEFQLIEDYKDRMIFFDQHFGIIPFNLPVFDKKLDIIFKQESVDFLTGIFNIERKNSLSFKKQFVFGNDLFVFDISPYNAKRQIFNEFIIEKFIAAGKKINFLGDKATLDLADSQNIIWENLSEAKRAVREIQATIKYKYKPSFKWQFVRVFYEGYVNAMANSIKKFPKARKIVELYLYSQGILFHGYMEDLNSLESFPLPMQSSGDFAGIRQKVLLLDELGIIGFLIKKNLEAGSVNLIEKISHTIALMTDIGMDKRNTISTIIIMDRLIPNMKEAAFC